MSSIDSTNRYQVQGPVYSFEELKKGGLTPVKFELTEAQIKEAAEYEKQEQEYSDAIDRYAEEHPAKIYGQVMVDGKVFATVLDTGLMVSSYNAGLKLTDGPAGMDLAKARLNEIAQQMHGKIKYSDFDKSGFGAGANHAVIPDWIPRPTARSIYEIVDSLCDDYMRSQVATATEKAAAEKVG